MAIHRRVKAFAAAMLVGAAGILAVTAGASAHTGEWAKFDNCPSTTPGVFKCLQSVTRGGEVVLGKKTVPIVNPVTVQGGMTEPTEEGATMIAATNGETLSKTPQPVPGGLAGLVNCKEIENAVLRLTCELTFENGLTGVNATLELARPANEVVVNELNIVFEEGTGLLMPVKVHLENPLLGNNCYIGSSDSPIIWNLTTGSTSPPPPNTSISGSGGLLEFKEEAQILQLQHTKLVDNAWSAPGASGCGGPLGEAILDPIINAAVGVPAAAGTNAAILEEVETVVALAEEVNNH
jgi:hypothetical protein